MRPRYEVASPPSLPGVAHHLKFPLARAVTAVASVAPRRAIESGQQLDQDMLDKLTALNSSGSGRVDRDFKVTALWILPVAAGMVVFAFALGFIEPQARTVLLGVAGLLAVLGIGFFIAARYTERWYQ